MARSDYHYDEWNHSDWLRHEEESALRTELTAYVKTHIDHWSADDLKFILNIMSNKERYQTFFSVLNTNIKL